MAQKARIKKLRGKGRRRLVRYTLDELRALPDRTRPDAPIGPDPPEEFWRTAKVVWPKPQP